MNDYLKIDAWVDAQFDEEVVFLQDLVRVPTDTPPGDNAPHAECAAVLLEGFGFAVEKHPVPADAVHARGLTSITNLVVRRRYGDGKTIVLNAHGDVVPPGEGWTHDPYGGEIVDGKLYGRASAVSKSDFATYAFAVRAVEALGVPLRGAVELHFTYDEEFGGETGPGWLLAQGLTHPDYAVAASFSYQVVVAHNGCLQLEVTVHGVMAHAAIPDTGVDALRGANAILTALYAENERYKTLRSGVPGISHPYVNVGLIAGGTNTNVVPGKVVLKLDRRMIPEEDPARVEDEVRDVIDRAAASVPGVRVDIRRMLLARALQPDARNAPLVEALRRHAEEVFGEAIPAVGTPLYTDVRPIRRRGSGLRTLRRGTADRARKQREARRRACRAGGSSRRDQGDRARAARPAGLSARPTAVTPTPRAAPPSARRAGSLGRRPRLHPKVAAGVVPGQRGERQREPAVGDFTLRRRERRVERLARVDDVLDRRQPVARHVGQRVEALGRVGLARGNARAPLRVLEHVHHARPIRLPQRHLRVVRSRSSSSWLMRMATSSGRLALTVRASSLLGGALLSRFSSERGSDRCACADGGIEYAASATRSVVSLIARAP